MNSKRIVMFGAVAGMTLGGMIPWLLGDHSLLDGWTLLGSFVGGMIGIWLGVQVAKRLG